MNPEQLEKNLATWAALEAAFQRARGRAENGQCFWSTMSAPIPIPLAGTSSAWRPKTSRPN